MIDRKKKACLIAGGLLISATLLALSLWDGDRSTPETQNKEVSLRAGTKDVSIDDMLSTIENRKPAPEVEPAYSSMSSNAVPTVNDDPEAIARVQALIRANEANISAGMQDIDSERQGITPQSSHDDPVPSPVARSRKNDRPAKVDTVSLVEAMPTKPQKRSPFNSISLSSSSSKNAIKAYVHSEQTVMEGSTLKMRLGEDAVTESGVLIPKNSPIFGAVTGIDGERVNVRITHINYQGNILPFEKLVYSKDALLGIYVPGNPKSDANKDVTGGALDGLPTNVPGLEAAQIAGAVASSALSAGKQVMSKNVKKVKVTIKTNYEIFLRPDEKNL